MISRSLAQDSVAPRRAMAVRQRPRVFDVGTHKSFFVPADARNVSYSYNNRLRQVFLVGIAPYKETNESNRAVEHGFKHFNVIDMR